MGRTTCARLNRKTTTLAVYRFEACIHHQARSCTQKGKRHRQDSNLRGDTPTDLESVAFTTRPRCHMISQTGLHHPGAELGTSSRLPNDESSYFRTKLMVRWTTVGGNCVEFYIHLIFDKWLCVVRFYICTLPGMRKVWEIERYVRET